MKIPRRDKLKIYNDLLSILEAESKKEEVLITKIQVKLNVPFDRFKRYLTQLEELGLIEYESSPKLTKKGRKYIRDYKKVIDFMKTVGISYS